MSKYTDHKSMPWALKIKKDSKIYFKDDDNIGKDTKNLINKAIALIKDFGSDHPIFSSITSVLLVISGIFTSLTAGLMVVGSMIGTLGAGMVRKRLSAEELKLKEAKCKELERIIKEGVKEKEKLKYLKYELGKTKWILNPKITLLVAMLQTIIVGFAAYLQFALAKLLRAKETLNKEKSK